MEFERKISKGRNWLKKIFFFLVKQKKKKKRENRLFDEWNMITFILYTLC